MHVCGRENPCATILQHGRASIIVIVITEGIFIEKVILVFAVAIIAITTGNSIKEDWTRVRVTSGR